MKNLIFATNNILKFKIAQKTLNSAGINLGKKSCDIEEIQSDSSEKIAIDKAKKAFTQIKKPLIINDSSWQFSALKGFPGPYMKFMNKWFEPSDFLSLMSGYKDRNVALIEIVVYINNGQLKLFKKIIPGKLIYRPKGNSGVSSDKIISISNNGLTISEEIDKGISNLNNNEIWDSFSKWYIKNQNL